MEIPSGAVTAMGVAMGVCFGLPFVFILANRKRLRLLPFIIGLAAWCAFSYFAAGVLLGQFSIPDSAYGAVLTALIQSIIVILGHALALSFISGRTQGPGVSLSYGLGYALINLVLVGGMQLFSKISLLTAVNENGFDKVASTVDDEQALRELIEQICAVPVYEHLLGALELVFFFMLTVASSVFIWYAVTKKRPALFAAAFSAELVSLGAVLLYSCGALESVIITEIIYGLCAAGSSVLAFALYRKYEGGPRYHADPVDRFSL